MLKQKRRLSLLLALLVVFTALPFTAAAHESQGGVPESTSPPYLEQILTEEINLGQSQEDLNAPSQGTDPEQETMPPEEETGAPRAETEPINTDPGSSHGGAAAEVAAPRSLAAGVSAQNALDIDDIDQLIDIIAESYKNTEDDWAAVSMSALGRGGDVAAKAILENALGRYENASTTDMARTILVLTSLGVNAKNIYEESADSHLDFVQKLGVKAPALINEAVFGLLALDCGEYEDNALTLNRQTCVDWLLQNKISQPNGRCGWAFFGSTPETDMTAMVISALAPYRGTDSVGPVVDGALDYLSNVQTEQGHFGDSNATAMVTVALCALGQNPADRQGDFAKNQRSVIDGLLEFKTDDNRFGYQDNSNENKLSTEQAFRALAAYSGYIAAKTEYSIYRFGSQNGDGTELAGDGNSQDPPAGGGEQKSVTVRAENLLDASTVIPETQVLTSGTQYDALKAALAANGKNPDTDIVEEWGYVSSILGTSAGSDTGWMYCVNGQVPWDSLADLSVSQGDELIMFFINWYDDIYLSTFDKKTAEINQGQKLSWTLTGMKTWGEDSYTPIAGASIFALDKDGNLYGEAALTDQNGNAELTFPDAGTFTVTASKKGAFNENTLVPALCKVTSVPAELSGSLTVTDEDTPISGTIAEGQDASLALAPVAAAGGVAAVLPQVSVARTAGSGEIALEIEKGIVVSAPAGWDGKISLPKLTNVSLAGLDVSMAIEVGSDVDLTFDKPVRLVLPGMAGKRVGFIDSSGSFYEITNNLASDSAAALGGANDGKISLGGDLVIWTKHFTSFVAFAVSSGSSGSGGSGSSYITARVTVRGDDAMGTLISGYSVSVPNGSSAWDAVKAALDGNGLSYTNPTGNYVQEINGLAEFDRGVNSGWLYNVNGKTATVGIGDHIIKNADAILVRYVLDYTLENSSALAAAAGAKTSLIANALPTGLNLKKELELVGKKTAPSEWEVLLLVANGYKISEGHLVRLQNDFDAKGGQMRLATDYARLALISKAMGSSITAFGNYNLLDIIVNNKDMGKQGVNGYIFSLIAITDEQLPQNSFWNSTGIIKEILKHQNQDGGFALSVGTASDADITAMALTSLAPFKTDAQVKASIDKGLAYLSAAQGADGFFVSAGEKNSESLSQVIIALCSLGIDPAGGQFSKNNKTLLDNLAQFALSSGGFSHTIGGAKNDIATEQAMTALTAYNIYKAGQGGFYSFVSRTRAGINPNSGVKNPFTDLSEDAPFFDAALIAHYQGLLTPKAADRFGAFEAVDRSQFLQAMSSLKAQNTVQLPFAEELGTQKGTAGITCLQMADMLADFAGQNKADATQADMLKGACGDESRDTQPALRWQAAQMIINCLNALAAAA